MAKVNFGAVVNDARGKVNGNVFSKNRSGPYIRRKVTPTNPATVAQAQARQNFAIASQTWSGTLTSLQRSAWTAFANLYPINNVFGLAIQLNGLNTVVKVNTVLNQIGATPLTDPPASPATIPIPIVPEILTVLVSTAHMEYQQAAAAPTSGTMFYLFGTPPLPAGRNATPSDYRFIGTVPPATTGFPATLDIWSNYIGVFGEPLAGQKVNVLVSTVDPLVGIPTTGQPLQGIAT